MEKFRLKTIVFILLTGLLVSLTACNSESYTDAQKPIRNLGGGSAKSQKEAKLERQAERERRLKELAEKKQARAAQQALEQSEPKPAAEQALAPEQTVTTTAVE